MTPLLYCLTDKVDLKVMIGALGKKNDRIKDFDTEREI